MSPKQIHWKLTVDEYAALDSLESWTSPLPSSDSTQPLAPHPVNDLPLPAILEIHPALSPEHALQLDFSFPSEVFGRNPQLTQKLLHAPACSPPRTVVYVRIVAGMLKRKLEITPHGQVVTIGDVLTRIQVELRQYDHGVSPDEAVPYMRRRIATVNGYCLGRDSRKQAANVAAEREGLTLQLGQPDHCWQLALAIPQRYISIDGGVVKQDAAVVEKVESQGVMEQADPQDDTLLAMRNQALIHGGQGQSQEAEGLEVGVLGQEPYRSNWDHGLLETWQRHQSPSLSAIIQEDEPLGPNEDGSVERRQQENLSDDDGAGQEPEGDVPLGPSEDGADEHPPVAETDPTVTKDLAASLDNLGNVGPHEDALRTSKAVALRRKLAETDSSDDNMNSPVFDITAPESVTFPEEEPLVVPPIVAMDEPVPTDISTFVVCSPRSMTQAHPSDRPAILPEDIHMAEAKFPDGGRFFSVHSPDDAILWVEGHYDHTLLASMRTHGLGGPIAAMLSPEVPSLVIFGSILDAWVIEAAELLADLSNFMVMIRPLTDDPVETWIHSEEAEPQFESQFSGNTPDITGTTPDMDHDSEDPNEEVDETDSIEASDDDRESVLSTQDGDVNIGTAALRLRGGAGNGDNKYTPWNSPEHTVNIGLELRTTAGVAFKVRLVCQIRFTVQNRYTNKERDATRHQAISWTRFSVTPQSPEVLPDRSYSSIGFVVYQRSILACDARPCDGFVQPGHTVKTVNTQTLGVTGTASLASIPHPTGGVSIALNRIAANATEKQDDRVSPKWVVEYFAVRDWVRDGNYYDGKNVAYQPSDPEKRHPLDVEFSMGIKFDKPNADVPDICFTIRNQTMLWVSNKSLKAKGYGIIVLTSTYIARIRTLDDDEISVREDEVFDFSDGPQSNDQKVEPKVKDQVPLALSVGVSPGRRESGLLEKISSLVKKLTQRKAEPDSRIHDLPLYDLIARGWDATTEQWQMPVYPSLDGNLRSITDKDSSTHVWDIPTDTEKWKTPDAGPTQVEEEPGKGKEDVLSDKEPIAKGKGMERNHGVAITEEAGKGKEADVSMIIETTPHAQVGPTNP
ncbi:hypothetical protein B0H11DRAFT_1964373 [Mycena galericulata]|nr:hypothetical protein B0H11DRAFT_1964373 [Mycena galericulata]